MLDLDTVPGRRAEERLRSDLVVWLTTVSPAGQPQSSPVWFLWGGGELVIRSLGGSPRIGNIRSNPRVAVNLDTAAEGDEVVTMEGEVRIDDGGLSEAEAAVYRAKYERKVLEYGWTWDAFERDYPLVLRFRPSRIRAT